VGDEGRTRLLGIGSIDPLVGVARVEPDPGRSIVAAVEADHAGETPLHLIGERVIGGPHVGEDRSALRGRNFLGMQDGQAGRLVLVRRVGVPVGGALDPEPVDVAVFGHVGQPRHLGIFGVTIIDQRVKLRLAEAAPERG
jgi:hypothetical protein